MSSRKKNNSTKAVTAISHDDYRDFLRKIGAAQNYRDKNYYLARSEFLTNILTFLPCAVYILDYRTREYLYISKSAKSVLGHDSETFMKKGQEWSVNELLHPDDIRTINEQVFPFFLDNVRSMSDEDAEQSRFSISYRIKSPAGRYISVLQQYVILERDMLNNPLLTLGVISDISNHKTDSKIVFSISRKNQYDGYSTVLNSSFPTTPMVISPRELEVLHLLVQGLNSDEIGAKLHISSNTVKIHRQSLLQKSECRNTVELINHALLNGLV